MGKPSHQGIKQEAGTERFLKNFLGQKWEAPAIWHKSSLKYIIIIGISCFVMLIPVANWVELKTRAVAGSAKGIERSIFNSLGRPRLHNSKPTGTRHLSITSPATCLPTDHAGGLLISSTWAPHVTGNGEEPEALPRPAVPALPYSPQPTHGPEGQQGRMCLGTSDVGGFIWCLLSSSLMTAPSLQGCTDFWWVLFFFF